MASNKKIPKNQKPAKTPRDPGKCPDKSSRKLPAGLKLRDFVDALCEQWGDKAEEKINLIYLRAQAKKLVAVKAEDLELASQALSGGPVKPAQLRALGQVMLKNCTEHWQTRAALVRYIESLQEASRQ